MEFSNLIPIPFLSLSDRICFRFFSFLISKRAINQIEIKLHKYMSWQLIRVFNYFITWSVWKPCHFHILCSLCTGQIQTDQSLTTLNHVSKINVIYNTGNICMAWIVLDFWWVLKLQCISGNWWMFAQWWVIRNLIIENVIQICSKPTLALV